MTFETAKAAAAGIPGASDKAEVLSDIAAAQAKASDAEGARATLRSAKRAVAGIEEAFDRDLVLCDIAAVQAWIGDVVGAEQTLRENLDLQPRQLRLIHLASQYHSCVRRLNSLIISNCVTVSWRIDQRAFRLVEDLVQRLERIADESGDWIDKLSLYISIADMAPYPRAKTTLRKAVSLVGNESNLYGRALRYADIAKIQAKSGDADGARSTFEMARRSAAVVDDNDYRAKALARIAEAESEAAKALKAYAAIEAADTAWSLMRAGDVARAVASARKAQTPEARTMALVAVADRLLADEESEDER